MSEESYEMPKPTAAHAPGMRAPGAAPAPRRLPYSHGRRTSYGLLWAAWTALLSIAGFAALFGGQIFTGLIALVLAAFAGHYDYRIWTWRARRLLFFIIW